MTEVYETELSKVKEASEEFSSAVDKVVLEYSSDLDDLMTDLKGAVTQPEAISTDTLERYYAELTNLIYFVSSKVETLNVFSDMSKANYKENYNMAYLQACAEKDEKGKAIRTVAENTSTAEVRAGYSAMVYTVYDHAYKTLKFKVDMALEMVSTLKHILKRRMQDEYLNNQISFVRPSLNSLNEE